MFKEQEKKTKLAKATYLGPKDANDKSGKLLTLVLSYHYICMSLSITLHNSNNIIYSIYRALIPNGPKALYIIKK